MSRKDELTRKASDYLEYDKESGIFDPGVANGSMSIGRDIYHATRNVKTANERQDQLKKDTATRYGLSPEEDLDAFLAEEYQREQSKEYLVDGAILTCTNCTNKTVWIPVGMAEMAISVENKEDINTNAIQELEEDKVYGKLRVTENPDANVEGLKYATAADCIQKNNIPSFGNCKRIPDSKAEAEIFIEMKERNVPMDSSERTEGTCKYLMKLEKTWENYEIGKSFLTFNDEKNGKKAGITMTSILFCKHGGFIYPVTSGQTMVQEDNYEAVFWYIDKDGNIVEVIWNISEEEFLDCNALSLEEIEKICNGKNPELVNRGFAKGIYNFCQKEGLNPKVLLATLGQEQGWCKNGNYEKVFGVGAGGNPEEFGDSNGAIAAAGRAYINRYNEGLQSDSLLIENVNHDGGPQYPETKAVFGEETDDWQKQHSDYVQYMEEGQDIECVNAAMYAKLKYTPWVDFPPQNSHPLEDWLNIYNSLEEHLLDE